MVADVGMTIGALAFLVGCVALATWLLRQMRSEPEESSAAILTREMVDAATWTRQQIENRNVIAKIMGELVAVRHVGASETRPAAGAIGTLSSRPSADLLTYAEQVRGDGASDWAGFDRALVDYENAMLRNAMVGPDLRRESTQQRIDRWLSEGGVGVRHARAETRQAVSETWDSPSRELALVDRPDAERVAEAVLTS